TLATLTIALVWLLGGISFDGPSLGAVELAGYAVAWGASFIVLATTEEMLFRGYALTALSEAIGFWPAALAMAGLFGGLHLLNSGESWVGALNVVAYALFASLTLRRTGSLWFAIGMHAAWDDAQSYLYGVADSGVRMDGHLLQAHAHGPDWLTGGT